MKKWIIKVALILVILLIATAIGGYFYVTNKAPDYNETIDLEGFDAEVKIYYDQYAIPHIYAASDNDAFRALGYVHAKDRLWQMDILRRIAPGRLSELFGSGTLETDRFFRTMSIATQSRTEAKVFLNRTSDPLKDKVLGYVDGINQYIKTGSTTIEHQLLGVDMEPYTVEDVYNVIGYMAFSFSIAHKTEPIMDFIYHSLGPDYIDALDVHVSPHTTVIASNATPDISALSLHIDQLLGALPAPELIGSNSWVIGPGKTENKSVLFANDPHIGFSQPSVWYEAHIITPNLELYGYHIAGYPFAQLGHNRHHAIGLTMFENDDIDYYREKINPENPLQYWNQDQWSDMNVDTEVINIKDGTSDTLTIRSTKHGPVITDVVADIQQDDAVAMWWVYQKFPLRLFEASYKIITSQTLEDAREGAALIHAPGLNVMYGDVDGNIAWWAAAKLPKRPGHVNSKLILDGASGHDDIIEYYDFKDNPQSVNPVSGFVYSANNQSVNDSGMRPEGYYLPEDRARRITHLLNKKNDWKTDDVKQMLNDVTSNNAPEIVSLIIEGLAQSEISEKHKSVISILEQWDGSYQKSSIAPTIYIKLVYHVLHKMMKDELGQRWETFNGTHVMKRSIQPLIANDASKWWDDLSTETVEFKSEILLSALTTTVDELENQLGEKIDNWNWGSVHTLEHPHAFDANPSLKSYFNVGPYEVPGATEVINNYQFLLNGDGIYEVKAGPSSRRVIDLANLEGDSWGILPTGQSGNVLSAHYKDQALKFVEGGFRKQLMNQEEIQANARYVTIIK